MIWLPSPRNSGISLPSSVAGNLCSSEGNTNHNIISAVRIYKKLANPTIPLLLFLVFNKRWKPLYQDQLKHEVWREKKRRQFWRQRRPTLSANVTHNTLEIQARAIRQEKGLWGRSLEMGSDTSLFVNSVFTQLRKHWWLCAEVPVKSQQDWRQKTKGNFLTFLSAWQPACR